MKKLETNHLYLRNFKLNDSRQVFENWASNEEIASECDFKTHNNIYETKNVIFSIMEENENEMITVAIEEKSSKSVIGYLRAYEISIESKKCKITGGLGFKWRNKGYFEEALKIFIEYLHSSKNLHVVENAHYGYKPVIACILEKVGMTKEAVLKNRKLNKLTGICEDLVIYSSIK